MTMEYLGSGVVPEELACEEMPALKTEGGDYEIYAGYNPDTGMLTAYIFKSNYSLSEIMELEPDSFYMGGAENSVVHLSGFESEPFSVGVGKWIFETLADGTSELSCHSDAPTSSLAGFLLYDDEFPIAMIFVQD